MVIFSGPLCLSIGELVLSASTIVVSLFRAAKTNEIFYSLIGKRIKANSKNSLTRKRFGYFDARFIPDSCFLHSVNCCPVFRSMQFVQRNELSIFFLIYAIRLFCHWISRIKTTEKTKHVFRAKIINWPNYNGRKWIIDKVLSSSVSFFLQLFIYFMTMNRRQRCPKMISTQEIFRLESVYEK